jgi:hypothetical protein
MIDTDKKTMKIEPIKPDESMMEILKNIVEINKMIAERLALFPRMFKAIDDVEKKGNN